jgi:hypothetical protein
MFMADQQAAELTEPGIGPLYDPSPLVASHFASVVVELPPVVLSIRSDQIDGALLQSLTQWIGIVPSVRDYAPGPLPRPASWARDTDFLERGFRKRNFCRRGTFQPNSQRKTLTVNQYHPLRSLAALGFTDCVAPFLAGAKLPSRNVSSHLSSPSASSAPSRARHAFSQTSSSCHCFSRRQQVAGEGNSSGRKRHAAPVCRIHRMPSKQARFDAQGRPRLSFLRRGSGNNGAINSHCSSVTSFCRFFMTEAQHHNYLKRKYLA